MRPGKSLLPFFIITKFKTEVKAYNSSTNKLPSKFSIAPSVSTKCLYGARVGNDQGSTLPASLGTLFVTPASDFKNIGIIGKYRLLIDVGEVLS